MADIHSTNSNYVRYILFSETSSPIIIDEPIGWRDDELEITRHEEYHGVFFTFTGGLKFTGQAKEYIKDAYTVLGINARVLLVRQRLREQGDLVKFIDDYSAFVDYSTMVETEVDLTVNFNSYDLAAILEAHKDDDFELERRKDIDGNTIDELPINTMTLTGRSLESENEHVHRTGSGGSNGFWVDNPNSSFADYNGLSAYTPLTKLLSASGESRNASVDYYKCEDVEDMTASNMFFTAVEDDNTAETSMVTVSFYIDFGYRGIGGGSREVYIDLYKYKFNEGSGQYVKDTQLYSKKRTSYSSLQNIDEATGLEVECAWDEALGLRIWAVSNKEIAVDVYKLSIQVQARSHYEPTQDARFLFTHDVGKRLAYIISGQKGSFYSKFFGRSQTEENYVKTGRYGQVGNISGLWVRSFNDPSSNKYKSMTLSFKDWFKSAQATFNVGLGIDNVSNKERIRVEDLKYFYQNEAVIRLPNQITNVKRTVASEMFFSGVELGYEEGGDYSEEMGLDEPNTKSNWVTPIRRSELKYEHISKIRADDYAMEITRRKPQSVYPDEDTQRDEAIWWLDIVRDLGEWRQAVWSDPLHLTKEPRNINDPATFYGMLFTPQQVLFRHGWVIRAGLEKYTNRPIMYGTSKANNKLVQQFYNEDREWQQNDDLFVSDLERSRILPELIEFEHEVDDELLDQLLGFTYKEYANEEEYIRNFYFKVEFTNEFGQLEKGYIQSVKPNGKGKWVLIKANEGLLGEPGIPLITVAFSCNLAFGECDTGETDYPDLLYFANESGIGYPAIGDVVYTDEALENVYANGGTKTANGPLKTYADGISIQFTCP